MIRIDIRDTVFDKLPDALLKLITPYSHHSLVDVSKTLAKRYSKLHHETSPKAVGDILVEGFAKGLSWEMQEHLKKIGRSLFALDLTFGNRSDKELPTPAGIQLIGQLFEHVKQIRLRGKHVGDKLVESVLKSFASLRALSITDSDALTDDITHRIAPYTGGYGAPQTALRCLQLSKCRGPTAWIFETLINSCPSLERLDITKSKIPVPDYSRAPFAAFFQDLARHPNLRYVRTSHFCSIDSTFRAMRLSDPNLVLEEEPMSLLQRGFYKISDPLRPYLPLITVVGGVALLIFVGVQYEAVLYAQFSAVKDVVISRCMQLASNATECAGVHKVAHLMRDMNRFHCVQSAPFQEAGWTPLCTTFATHNATQSLWQKNRIQQLVEGFLVGTGTCTPGALPQNPMAAPTLFSRERAAQFCTERFRFLQYSTPVQKLCQAFTSVKELAKAVQNIAEEHLWPTM